MQEYKSIPIIVLDFETGGLDANLNAVVEVAAIAFNSDTLDEIARYEAILQPYSNDLLYNPDALAIHGVSMEMINQGVDFKTFTKDFIQFLKKANIYSHVKYRPLIAGHNIVFDIPFLQQLFFYMGKKSQDYFSTYKDYYGNHQINYLDTLKLTMLKWPQMIDHKLTSAVNKAGFELVNAHRAMQDVKSNTDLLQLFFKSLKDEKSINTSEEIVKEQPFRDLFKF